MPKKSAATQEKQAPKKVETKEKVEKDDEKPPSPVQELLSAVGELAIAVKAIQGKLKLVVKDYEKQQKHIDKEKQKREKARKSPSGFAKPNKISNELCDFMGISHGTEKSRTDVTKFITAYVKQHNLYNSANRRFLKPDAKLKKILGLKDGDEASFFNLQRLISHHFPPPKSALIAAAMAELAKK